MDGDHVRAGVGAWLLSAAAFIGLGMSIFAFFWPYNGIHGMPGVILVIVTTALMLIASLVIAIWPGTWRWLKGVLLVLIALDILGTGFAAYMLDDYWLLGAMVLAGIGWIVHLVADPGRPRSEALETIRAGGTA